MLRGDSGAPREPPAVPETLLSGSAPDKRRPGGVQSGSCRTLGRRAGQQAGWERLSELPGGRGQEHFPDAQIPGLVSS